MGDVSVFKVCASPLNISEAVAILSQLASSQREKISSLPPVAPKGGEIYIFQGDSDDQRGINYVHVHVLAVILERPNIWLATT